MSIKKKKDLKSSKNRYRIRRIEEYLVSKGYVQIDPSQSFQRWVDCVSQGRDICFNVNDITKDGYNLDRELQRLGGYGKDGYFMIDAPRVHEVYTDASTVEEAVKRSRHVGNWKS